MAHVADHLSVSALEQQYRSCTDVTAARHRFDSRDGAA